MKGLSDDGRKREFTDVLTGDSVLFSEGDDGSEGILVKVSDLGFLFWDGVIVGTPFGW